MANELLVGVKIGAALSGTFQAAFASARGTSLRLGQAADELRVKHDRLGAAMARAMAHPTRNIGELNRQYQRLGQTIDQLRAKQEKLAASMARGDALKAARADLRGQAMETAGTAFALGAPVVQSVRLAASFQDQVKDTAITGEFSPAEEARLAATIRESALKWNQTQAEIARGTGVLVAGGIQNAKALEAYAPVMAKAATATRASMDDLGRVVIALRDNLKIGEAGFEGALNMLAYAGKRGQFEIRDMAKWLPTLTPSFAAMGITGKEAVAEIGAALQIARKGAGSNDEAANNFRNFLQKLFSQDTKKDFEKAGIDIEKSLKNLREKGLTPVQGMLEIITQYMGKKSPEAADQFQKAMAIKDDKERETALQRISEAYKLGELFQDMQAMSFIRPAIANMGEMKAIKQGSMDAADKGLLDADFKKRMAGATEQFKAFKVGMMDIGITIGDALLPPLTELLQEIRPGIKAFGDWAKEHPGLIKGVIGLVGGLLAGKMAFIGLKYGINLVLSPFNALTTSVTAVSGKWTLLRAMWQAGRFAPAIAGLRSVSAGILTVGRFLLPFGQGLLMTFGAPLMLAGRGALFLGRLLVSNLVPGLRLAGQAVLWLGRAMLMNPIGLAVTAIGVAAYLVWKNWDKVKGAVMAGWNWMKGMKNQFFSAGADLINGLVNGVTSKLSAARDSIVSFGSSIKGWFTSTLGIKSPSRVFMGFGDNIAQGTALGVARSAALAGKAVTGMALASATAWGQPQLPTPQFEALNPIVQQRGRQLLEPAYMPDMANVLQTVSQRLRPVDVPQPPTLTQGVRQLLDPVTAQPPRTLHQPVRQVLEPVQLSGIPDASQTVRQALRPVDAGQPQMLHQPVRQALKPVQLPGIPDASQTVRQYFQAAEMPQLPTVSQNVRRVLQPIGAEPPQAELTQRVHQAQAAMATGPGSPQAGKGGMTIQFAPTITVQGADPKTVGPQVTQAIQMSFTEFERMMKRYEHEKHRTAYGRNV